MNTPQHHPSRRRIIALAAGALPAGLLAGSIAACSESSAQDRQLSFLSLSDALGELDRLTNAEPLPPPTAWAWAPTLLHLAQSIEFSMTGYPQARSRFFQVALGAPAFKVFNWRGRMTHDLGEPIPGAPPLDSSASVDAADYRLRQAADAFAQWDKPLQPHFAYGELSKAEYDSAHAMHLANHFSAFEQKT